MTTLIVLDFDLRQNSLRVRPDHLLPEKAMVWPGAVKVPVDSVGVGSAGERRPRGVVGVLLGGGGTICGVRTYVLETHLCFVHFVLSHHAKRSVTRPDRLLRGIPVIPILTTHLRRLEMIWGVYRERDTVAKTHFCFLIPPHLFPPI